MNYQDTKKLCDDILKEEIKKNNLDIHTYSFGKLNYYNSSYFKNSILLSILTRNHRDLLTFLQLPFAIKGGYIENEKSLLLFLNDNPIIFKNNNITKTLHVLYHEIYHAKDFSYTPVIMDYNKFSSYIDRYIRNLIPNNLSKYNHSKEFHDYFMFEILANLYSIMKIKKFIKKNPDKYNYDKKYLYKKCRIYHQQYLSYNLAEHIDIVLDNYSLFKKRRDFDRTIFNIFINEDGSFKDIYSIMTNPIINIIDERIIYSFFNTKTFKSINRDLSSEENFYIEEILTMKKNNSTKAKQKKYSL